MKLTVIIRDDAPMFHCQDAPKFRTISFPLTPEQESKICLAHTYSIASNKYYEEISRVILEH